MSLWWRWNSPPAGQTNITETIMSIEELQAWTDQTFSGSSNRQKIDWIEFLSMLFSKVPAKITKEQSVWVSGGFSTLRYTLDLVQTTDPDVLKNYALLKIMFFMAQDSHPRTEKMFQFHPKGEQPLKYAAARRRAQHCLWNIMDIDSDSPGVSFALIPEFRKRISQSHIIETVENLLNSIKSSYKDLLRSGRSSYISQVGSNLFAVKVERLQALIGWPQWTENDHILNRFYSHMHIQPDNHYGNAIQMRALRYTYRFTAINLPMDKYFDFWTTSPFLVNAEYSRPTNRIVLPIGLIQSTEVTAPNNEAVLYGRLGFVIAHEIAHALDLRGIYLDENALMRNWLPNSAKQSLYNLNRQLARQYSAYVVQLIGTHVDGDATFNENLADQFGISVAYYTFEIMSRNINNNQRRLFFYAFATMWCSVETELSIRSRLEQGYAPYSVRINASLNKFQPFQMTFRATTDGNSNKTQLWSPLWKRAFSQS